MSNKMSFHHPAQTFEAPGCSITLRRVDGPEARELFMLCRPHGADRDTHGQAHAIYQAIAGILAAEGSSGASLVTEKVFLRNGAADIAAVRAARQEVRGAGPAVRAPATTEIGQPPLDHDAMLQVSAHAVLPKCEDWQADSVHASADCGCGECARPYGVRIRMGDEIRFHAGGLCGPGANAYEQTLGMYRLAENLLQQAGLDFRDVVRTWIHLRDIDRDYPHLNLARRAFFADRGIEPAPASTGIGAAPIPAEHDLSLGFYALRREPSLSRSVMTSPTLNEAMQYGADFVRGMKVVEANKVALHVSGTASIDEYGRSVHVEDFDAQADRMLVNISALLDGQGAGFGDIVSAITYVKRPEDASRMGAKLREAGFEGFPNAMVLAPICRPELLCEIEALAVLPTAAIDPDRQWS